MKDIVIIDAVRSAVGRAHKGSLSQKRPDELAGEVVRGLLARNPKVSAAEIEDLVLGCAMPEGEQGLNVARVVELLGGLPQEASAQTINRFCASGLQAIATAAGTIAMGSADLVLAGGVESMSMVPMTGNKLSASPEAMEKAASVYTPMGITAENVAKKFNVEREAQDKFALRSQKNGSEAVEKKVFAKEIVPVTAYRYAGEEKKAFTFDADELPRPDTTLEGLAALKPAFTQVGSVTAGNSSPLSDGAAAALVASADKAKALGVTGLGYLRAFVSVGVDPAIMGIGPVPAIKKLLAKTGMKIDQIDRFEINEAFASQAVYVQRELGIDDKVLNPNGGAIALGHPLGCTGAKLTATLLHGLHRTGGKWGIVSMCIGGGQGAAALFERI
ncbi:MAG: thiolase family protein [Labilithrix sp.]|nr:thiolase family protein [Labilithrix sp.]MCW5812768.1 thiolase family protein [Labilithrix sp.]